MSLWSLVAVGAQAEVTAAGTLTLAEPAGVASGDLMVACIVSRTAAVPTIPAGWTNVASQASGNNTVNSTGSIASGRMDYIVRGGSAPALGWTWGTADIARGAILAYRRTDGGVPVFDQASSSTLGSASVTQSTAGITTVEEDELLVMAECAARGATNPSASNARATNPGQANWTEHTDVGSTGGSDAGLAISSAVKDSAGATGTFNWTAAQSARGVTIVGAFRAKYNVQASFGSYVTTGQRVSNPAGVIADFMYESAGVPPTPPSALTFSSVPIGEADANRSLAIGVFHSLSSSFGGTNLDTVTVDGVTATLLLADIGSPGCAWYSIPKASGTNADISVTLRSGSTPDATDLLGVVVYRVLGGSLLDSATDEGTAGSDHPTYLLDSAKFGVNLILSLGGAYATTFSTHTYPSPFAKDIESNPAFFGLISCVSSASRWTPTAATNESITVTISAGTGSAFDADTSAAISLRAQTAYGLVASNGTYAYTGQAAGLLVKHILTAAQGAYATSGQVIGLLKGSSLTANFGSYAYNGQTVTLSKGATLTADFGLYGTIGFDANLTIIPRNTWVEEIAESTAWVETGSITSSWIEQATKSTSWNKSLSINTSWAEESALSNTWTEELL